MADTSDLWKCGILVRKLKFFFL